MALTADFLVIGGGIIGLSTARELRKREPGARVILIEKERAPGLHASGRNSGVLHAGFYYSPDSLKARLTRHGNARLTEYCERHGLPILRCGKLVIAREDAELPGLEELYRRGLENGVALELITADDARRIEPRARAHGKAIWSPATATIDAGAVMKKLHENARDEGVDVHCDTAYVGRRADVINTSRGGFSAGFVVNAAGLQADTVARDFGFAERYRILPFRGNYLLSSEPPGAMRTLIYPVPDPAFPFLGVHFTLTANGTAKIGPTAAPALSREHYGGLRSIRFGEAVELLPRLTRLVLRDRALRRHVVEEVRKLSRRHLVEIAGTLATGVRAEDYRTRGTSGIRAQLYDVSENRLEMDFVIERDDRSLHVLNAVSPAFTCALPFAEYVVDQMI